MDNNITFISENIQNCFKELFAEGFKKCGYKNYNDTVHTISNYLMPNPNNKTFDYVLEKYPGVSKRMIIQMVITKFLELNYYRIKKDIVIDYKRATLVKGFLDSIVTSAAFGVNRAMVGISIKDLIPIISDAYLYLSHLSDTYSINACKDGKEDNFGDLVSTLYPLCKMDYVLNSEDNLSRKEIILGNIVEKIIDEIERVQFKNDIIPTFNSMYRQNNKMIIEEYSDNSSNDICSRIIDGFNDVPLENDDCILIMEMVVSILSEKKDMDMDLTSNESKILKHINHIRDNRNKLIEYYRINRDNIIKVFINNYFDIPKQDILKHDINFNKAKNKKID